MFARAIGTLARLEFLLTNLAFQLANLPVEADEVDDDAEEDRGDDRHYHPYFTVGPKPVSHLNGLLCHEVLANQQQGQQRKKTK